MRARDVVLANVGFVVEPIDIGSEREEYDLQGTGFFVAIPSAASPATAFHVFVTAAHVVKGLNYKTAILVNKAGGGKKVIRPVASDWRFHPTDEASVDVAVLPFEEVPGLTMSSILLRDFLDASKMKEYDIGIGDEVYVPGLFTFAPGSDQRNMPILRHGILSMLPDAPIQVDSGFEEVYLTEVRSIGGISGSPVYVRRTIHLSTTDDGDEVSGLGTRFYLLGLMRTHWDINAGKLNQQRLEVTRDGVNMGIGVVVPSAKIIEVINHPDFVVARQEAEERLRDSIRTTSD